MGASGLARAELERSDLVANCRAATNPARAGAELFPCDVAPSVGRLPGKTLRRSTRRYWSQREPFYLTLNETSDDSINAVRCGRGPPALQ